MDTDWERLWRDAESIKDRIRVWLGAFSLPKPEIFIVEKKETHPRPSAFTFVVRVGLLEETHAVPSDLLDDYKADVPLYAQSVAEYFYRQVVKG